MSTFTLDSKTLREYATITDEEVKRKIRPTSEFMANVIDRYMHGTNMSGIKLPFAQFDNLFRLRGGEITILAGINGSGKSMFAGQVMLNAIDQGYKCLSISLEMSPEAQVARMVRQASLKKVPDMDACLSFQMWSDKGGLHFYDQYGSVDTRTLMAVIRYAKEVHKVDFVLVDSLMTMSMASDDWNGQKDVVCALANAARGLDVHVMLVTHARKSGSIKDRLDKWSIAGSADITNRADNVIIMGRLYEMDGADAYLSLAKARHFDGAEMDLDLHFDMDSLNYWFGDTWPTQFGMKESIKPDAGPLGLLEEVGLNDNKEAA